MRKKSLTVILHVSTAMTAGSQGEIRGGCLEVMTPTEQAWREPVGREISRKNGDAKFHLKRDPATVLRHMPPLTPLGSWPPVIPSTSVHTTVTPATGPRPDSAHYQCWEQDLAGSVRLWAGPLGARKGQVACRIGPDKYLSAVSPGPSPTPGLGGDSSSAPRTSLWGTAFYTCYHLSPLSPSPRQTSSTRHRT